MSILSSIDTQADRAMQDVGFLLKQEVQSAWKAADNSL